jgi:quinol monooxygenase YgiN
MKSVIVIVAYKPKPGKADALNGLVKTHVSRLRKEGLVTHREPTLLQAANGTVIEMFEWLSQEAIQQAHRNEEVHKMWAEFAEVCDYVPLSELPETKGLFAEFTPLNYTT